MINFVRPEAVEGSFCAIVEAFSSMQEDLDKEKKVIMKQWAKREEQIERMMSSTVGMYGDLQDIAGKSLQETEGLELKAIGVSGAKQSSAQLSEQIKIIDIDVP